MLRGITITLYDKIEVARDGFNKPIYEEIPVEIDNVLISPSTQDDVLASTSIEGRKAVYTLAIPKGDTHEWENRTVEFYGKKWKTFGIPVQGIDNLIPLSWNKKVMVDRYE